MAMNPDYNHPTEIIGQIQNLHLVFFYVLSVVL